MSPDSAREPGRSARIRPPRARVNALAYQRHGRPDPATGQAEALADPIRSAQLTILSLEPDAPLRSTSDPDAFDHQLRLDTPIRAQSCGLTSSSSPTRPANSPSARSGSFNAAEHKPVARFFNSSARFLGAATTASLPNHHRPHQTRDVTPRLVVTMQELSASFWRFSVFRRWLPFGKRGVIEPLPTGGQLLRVKTLPNWLYGSLRASVAAIW